MRATKSSISEKPLITVDTEGLQAMLGSGRRTAVDIGTAAEARVQIGRRVLWNISKVKKYLDAISE